MSMSFDPSRRIFMRGASAAALGIGFAPSALMMRTAQAAVGSKVFVQIFIRGGADTLNMVVPYGESAYYDIRGAIAIPRPGQAGGALRLDDTFGLHPSLSSLMPLWSDGRLAIIDAVGNYDLSRSHFDAQDFMETGTPAIKTTSTGWLDRAIKMIPGSSVSEAVAFQAQLPRSFMGGEPVLVASNLTTFNLKVGTNWRTEAETALRAMYGSRTDDVGKTGRETFEAIDTIIRSPALSAAPSNGAVYANTSIGNSLRQTAGVIKAGLGTRTIFISLGGAFDTHSNQLMAHQTELPRIGDALAAFVQDLGGMMDNVVVMMVSEFGRTAYVNGSAGTDHGSAKAVFVLGGGVRGGRMLGRWPGLSATQLYQNRDLAATTDFRDVYGEIARKQLGLTDMATLFPGYNMGTGVNVLA
ncbi:MAG: DUF1501 domain-containing protein [Vicinamibacteria bacterium]